MLLAPAHGCRRSIERARYISERAPDGALSAGDLDGLDVLSTGLADYQTWSETDTEQSFPAWCQERGRDDRFLTPVYSYDTGTRSASSAVAARIA